MKMVTFSVFGVRDFESIRTPEGESISYPPTCKSVEELKKILKSFSGMKE